MAIWTPNKEQPSWIEIELRLGSVTVGKCSECGALLPQEYCEDPSEAIQRMDRLFENHVKERHSAG